MRLEAEAAGGDHAERRHLRDRQIDEDDAAPQDLLAEGDVRGENEHARDQRGRDDAEPDRIEVHFGSNKVLTITSNMPNRSSAPAALPTVCGSTTYGIDVLAPSHSDAFPSS